METLSRVCGAITGSTALSASIAVLSIWVCWLQRDERDLVWKISCATAVLGLAGIVFTIREELESQDEKAKVSANLVASQREVAELLRTNKELLRVNQEMARRQINRADILSDEARESLKSAFAKCPEPIGLIRINNSAEAAEFADVLEELLRNAGRLGSQLTVDAGSIVPHPKGRVLIRGGKGEASRPFVEALARAFIDAGITDVVTEPTPPGPQAISFGGLVAIFVKSK